MAPTEGDHSATPYKAPIWFIAHGGPPTLFQPEHPAHKHWKTIAQEIIQQGPELRGIVFISAHWQADARSGDAVDPEAVVINESTGLLYDYYNFPKKFYELQLETHNPSWLQEEVESTLRSAGTTVTKDIARGIDHGVFIPLLAMFGRRAGSEGHLPPLLQLSLPAEDASGDVAGDGLRALRLGRKLTSLRNKGIAIIGGGQPVHNLREYSAAMREGPAPGLQTAVAPPRWATNFAEAASKVVTGSFIDANGHSGNFDGGNGSNGDSDEKSARWAAALSLFRHPHYRLAHPTAEHLLPLLVCIGAASEEAGQEKFQMVERGLGWGMYSWGSVTGPHAARTMIAS